MSALYYSMAWLREQSESGAIKTYDPAFSWDKGSIVIYQDDFFEANENIPAGLPFAIGVSGQTWRRLSDSAVTRIDDHDPAKSYDMHEPIHLNGRILRSKAAIPPGPFVATEWESVTGPVLSVNRTSLPTVAHNAAAGYALGSEWCTTQGEVFKLAYENGSGDAIWKRMGSPKNTTGETGVPTDANDSSEGFTIGSLWVTADLQAYIMTAQGTGGGAGAVWIQTTSPLLKIDEAFFPTPSDNASRGYSIGSEWHRPAGTSYKLVRFDGTAAVWEEMTLPKSVYEFPTYPTAFHDNTQDFRVGSRWFTQDNAIFVMTDAATNNAVWKRISNPRDNLSALRPSLTDDLTEGYERGSRWFTTAGEIWMNTSPGIGASLWKRIFPCSDVVIADHDDALPYLATQLVYRDGYMLRCKVDIGAKAFDEADWDFFKANILIAHDHDPAKPYFKDQLIVKDGEPWRCDADIPPQAWDEDDWTPLFSNGLILRDYENDEQYAAQEIIVFEKNIRRSLAAVGIGIFNEVEWEHIYAERLTYANTAPTVSDDIDSGIEIGHRWFDTGEEIQWLCMDNAAGAAKWKSQHIIADAFNSTVDPQNSDGETAGFEIGSRWWNATDERYWMCIDPTDLAARWIRVDRIKHTNQATAAPTQTDDVDAGWEVGSVWAHVALENIYVCMVNTAGAAVWIRLSSIKHKLDAIIDPTVDDDEDGHFEIGSMWLNVADKKIFFCLDVTDGAAIWQEVTSIKNNYSAAGTPTVNDDDTQEYVPGSTWVSDSLRTAWVCSDNTTGAAVWLEYGTYRKGVHGKLITQVGHGLLVGWTVRPSDAGWVYAVADTPGNLAWGLIAEVPDDDTFYVVRSGTIRLPGHGVPPGTVICTHQSDPGGSTPWIPTSGLVQIAGVVIDANTIDVQCDSVWDAPPKNNAEAGPPAAINNEDQGYAVHSRWLDTDTDDIYFCKNATNGATVWLRVATLSDEVFFDITGTVQVGAVPGVAIAAGTNILTTDATVVWDRATADLGAMAPSAMNVFVNGIEMPDGTATWVDATTFTMSVPLYADDTVLLSYTGVA